MSYNLDLFKWTKIKPNLGLQCNVNSVSPLKIILNAGLTLI